MRLLIKNGEKYLRVFKEDADRHPIADKLYSRLKGMTAEEIDREAAKINSRPTQEQIKAGNYKKAHITIQGLAITIENAAGSTRRGIDRNGKTWAVWLTAHYGYIKNTESEADEDHIDVFIGPHPDSELVFIVDQHIDGVFDEHKCLIGWNNIKAATKAYLSNYSKNWKGLGAITPILMSEFKEWVITGDTGIPYTKEW